MERGVKPVWRKTGNRKNAAHSAIFPVKKSPSAGCGKLCGKGVKLPVFPGGQGFSTATRQTVFRCGKRFSAMRAMSCQIRRPRPAPAENSTFCPPFSDGFANGFPSENLRPRAENASIDAEIRVFPFFHTLHTPYYDYYDFILSILSSFLSPAQARASQNKSHHPMSYDISKFHDSLKVLEILKNFFQEVFKQGLGQSPKVLKRGINYENYL